MRLWLVLAVASVAACVGSSAPPPSREGPITPSVPVTVPDLSADAGAAGPTSTDEAGAD